MLTVSLLSVVSNRFIVTLEFDFILRLILRQSDHAGVPVTQTKVHLKITTESKT